MNEGVPGKHPAGGGGIVTTIIGPESIFPYTTSLSGDRQCYTVVCLRRPVQGGYPLTGSYAEEYDPPYRIRPSNSDATADYNS